MSSLCCNTDPDTGSWGDSAGPVLVAQTAQGQGTVVSCSWLSRPPLPVEGAEISAIGGFGCYLRGLAEYQGV